MTDNPRKEMLEQIDIVNWLKAKDIFFFSVPNEGRRHFGELANMKKMGLHKGASDMIIMLDDVMLAVEVKKRKKVLKSGKLSTVELVKPEQYDFQKTVNKYPYAISIIAFGFEDFKRKINIIINRKKIDG